ncbi:MAG TPA: Fe(3+)-hydroxamate ABC transporter permease FhuB [Alcaligenes sp.]|nr:Fe(3+)-hydroxamate ABC transporter permease FhuB [Alcaligenes sp.]
MLPVLGLLIHASLMPLGGAAWAFEAMTVPLQHASAAQLLLSQSWWPRLAVALLAGGGLALCGELLQLLLRNPLASDHTLGVASGASLCVMLATLYAPQLLLSGPEWIAMAGAALTLLLVCGMGWQRALNPVTLVVTGMTLNLLMGGLSMMLLMFNHEQLSGLLIWGAGSLAQQGWGSAQDLVVRVLLAGSAVLLLIRPLQLMSLDDAALRGLGISVRFMRFYGLGIAVFLAGSLVSHVGVIGFIGLSAPAVMRLAGAVSFQSRLPLSILFGALLLASADQAVQIMGASTQAFVPTGAMTALFGVPLLLWLLTRLPPSTQAVLNPTGMLGKPCRRPVHRFFWLSMALVLAVGLAASLGQRGQGWQWLSLDHAAILEWRLPRTIAALCSGVMLALAGTILQRTTGNALASPELLGVSSSSAILLVVGVFVLDQPGYLSLAGMALLGALLALALIIGLNRRNGFSTHGVILTGVALGAAYEALRSLLLADADPRGQQVTAWLAGSTYYVTAFASLLLLALLLIAVPLARASSRWLDILPLGGATAQSLGVPLKKARLSLLLLAAGMSALATLVVGPLSFVGLMAPHLARTLGFNHARRQLQAAALIGGLLMVLADWLGRQILFPYEIPAGLIASVLGAIYFLGRLQRR